MININYEENRAFHGDDMTPDKTLKPNYSHADCPMCGGSDDVCPICAVTEAREREQRTPPTPEGMRSAEAVNSTLDAIENALIIAAEHVPSDPTKASHPMVDAERLVQVVRNAIASQAEKLRDALYPYGVKHPQQSEWEWLIKCVVEMREQLVFAEAALTEQSEKLRKMRELLKRYRTETPLGNQPRMIAHEVDAALSDGE